MAIASSVRPATVRLWNSTVHSQAVRSVWLEVRQGKPGPSGLGSDLGGDVEHGGDAQADPSLFDRRQGAAKCCVSEAFALLGESCRKKGEDTLCHQSATEGVALWRQLEPALGKRCRTRRVGQGELLGRLEHGLYRYVVSRLGALGELERHLGRQGTSSYAARRHLGDRVPVGPGSGKPARTASRMRS